HLDATSFHLVSFLHRMLALGEMLAMFYFLGIQHDSDLLGGLVLLEDLTLVDPNVDANVAIGHVSTLTDKVDVGTERLKRDLTLIEFLCTSDLSTSYATWVTNTSTLSRFVGKNLFDSLLHETVEG